MKKLLATALIISTLSGCATVQHPTTPGVQYGSVEQCQRQNPDTPHACEKVIHQQATNQAIRTGAAVLVGLGYAAWIIWLLSGR